MRVAYFSPLPPQPSGIADYSANLLSPLSAHCEITLFVDQPTVDLARLPAGLPVRSSAEFQGPLREQFDMCLYQMGNNIRYHAQVYATLLRFPGIVVLHDPNLHAFYIDRAARAAAPCIAFVREMAFAYGKEGAEYARQLFTAGGPRQDERYPLFTRLTQVSVGIILHSAYAQQMILRVCPAARTRVVQQPVPVLARTMSKTTAKEQLGLPPDALLLASFGYAAPNKHIHRVIDLLSRLRSIYPNLHYAVVGAAIPGYDLAARVADLGLTECVHLTGYIDQETYSKYLWAADAGVNLRFPTNAETSAALLQLMAAGIPTIVADADAFHELPDAAVIKVKPDDAMSDRLAEALAALLGDPLQRAQVGAQAQHYIATQASPLNVAADYASFLQNKI